MTKQRLNLFQFSAGGPAQRGARPSKVVRRKARYADLGGVLARHLPDHFPAEAIAIHHDHHAAPAERHGPRTIPVLGPGVDGDFHPIRHWSRSDAPVLADKTDDAPTAIPFLDMRESECGDFQTGAARKHYCDEYLRPSHCLRMPIHHRCGEGHSFLLHLRDNS